ncbi:MAG: hypothetical protein QOJ75_307, partial [Chloroflexota bacterium]|nr:hypothetical protein [Chloroflexota bacterium]
PRGRTRPQGDADEGTGGAGGTSAGARPAQGRPTGGRPPGSRPDGTDSPGSRPTGGRAAGSGTGPRRGKATLGSTSYDGADAGPFEPDWGGASWYGTSSGTYWTINPKEYADPRKHGPEYQARARRSSTSRSGTGTPSEEAPETLESESPDTDSPGSSGEPGESRLGGAAGAPGRAASGAASDATHTTASWWNSTAGPEAAGSSPRGEATGPTGGAADDRPFREASPSSGAADPDPARAAAELARALTDPGSGGLRGRILRAFFGWLPIAFGLGWLFGELTGCGRFAATCDPSVNPLILVIQGAALVALVLVPAAASLAAMASLSLLSAAVAATLILSATGSAADEGSRRATLGVLLLAAWIAGLIVAIARRLRSVSARVGPVS